jgi:hypothetical protein
MAAREKRGGHVHLNATLDSALDGHVVLSTGEGMLVVRADLRVGTENDPVPDAWGAGDDAVVPDLASGMPGAHTVPNAQNAVRQGKLLDKNVVASLRHRKVEPYLHRSLGTVATLGLGHGIFQYKRIVIKGLPAWLIHRGYHVLAVPSGGAEDPCIAGLGARQTPMRSSRCRSSSLIGSATRIRASTWRRAGSSSKKRRRSRSSLTS